MKYLIAALITIILLFVFNTVPWFNSFSIETYKYAAFGLGALCIGWVVSGAGDHPYL